MIQGEQKVNTEQDYREIMIDSSSSLKDFSMDRRKYYRRHIANEQIEDKENQAILTGKLVETLLFEEHLFDDKFYISACTTAPSGLMANFVEALYEATISSTDEDGVVGRDFESLSMEAYEKSGYKLPYKTVLGKFVGSDDEIYYNEIRHIRPKKLSTVTVQDVTNAEAIVSALRNSPITKDVVTMVDDVRYSVLTQHQIEGFEIDGHKFKMMMDYAIIDHKNKTIQPYDLKVTWNVENFYEEYYLYRRSYIQAYVYYRGVDDSSYNESSGFHDYEVLPPRFIVADSINYYSPLIYKLSSSDLLDAYNGFEYKGRKYPGVQSIIENLKFALDMNIWNISKENYLNNGVVNIKG